MCNRYRMTPTRVALMERYGVTVPFVEPPILPPPELFPRRPAYVIRHDDGARALDVMQWGFPPPAKGNAPVTNVRNYASPFWRFALANPDRRCLVPFQQFCEWSGEKGRKVEHWFSIPAEPVSSFAGVWRPVEGGRVFAFLTSGYLGEPAAHIVGAVHSKAIPVVLHRDDEDRWLNAHVDEALELAQPFPSQMMTVTA